jgi:phosphatidylglycerol---prolipoprotein diacylglyceryl transferase
MFAHPRFDPVALKIGPVSVRWYGVMYMLGFGLGWLLGRVRAKKPWTPLSTVDVDDLVAVAMFGLIVGGRVGYVLFYDLPTFLANPLDIFMIWKGGMSFHGGLLGICLAIWLFARKRRLAFFEVTDFFVPLTPLGLLAGRLGNFINGELWGRPTDMPWGMIFFDPAAGLVPRHPSQLYEAFLEGVVLFTVVWWYSSRPRPRMAVSGLFLALYGLFRFSVEFVRQPDPQLGFIAFGWLTMGQLLSLPMLVGGLVLLWLAYRRKAA